LLKNGADPNHLLNEGISAFHVAVGKADAKFTNLFLKYGANVNVR
jgi:ankyrin repeat protein